MISICGGNVFQYLTVSLDLNEYTPGKDNGVLRVPSHGYRIYWCFAYLDPFPPFVSRYWLWWTWVWLLAHRVSSVEWWIEWLVNYASLHYHIMWCMHLHSQPSYCLTIQYHPLWFSILCHVMNASTQYTVNPPTVWLFNITHCGSQYHVMWWMHLHSIQTSLLLSDHSITTTLLLSRIKLPVKMP